MVGGGEGDEQLWESGRGAIAGPVQGANLCFISSFYFPGHQFHPDTNEFCLELLADVTLFFTLITQKLVFAWFLLSGVYAAIIFHHQHQRQSCKHRFIILYDSSPNPVRPVLEPAAHCQTSHPILWHGQSLRSSADSQHSQRSQDSEGGSDLHGAPWRAFPPGDALRVASLWCLDNHYVFRQFSDGKCKTSPFSSSDSHVSTS